MEEEPMTNQQMKTILKMIEQIIKACDTKEESVLYQMGG